MKRRAFLKSAGAASGLLTALPLSRSFAAPAGNEFPLVDLHVHLTPSFTIDHVMEISKKTGVQFGIMVNPGFGVNDDTGLRGFIESLKPYPVYRGLQPMSPGWSRNFSPQTVRQLDYVLIWSDLVKRCFNRSGLLWRKRRAAVAAARVTEREAICDG
jgi:hypothetical protein